MSPESRRRIEHPALSRPVCTQTNVQNTRLVVASLYSYPFSLIQFTLWNLEQGIHIADVGRGTYTQEPSEFYPFFSDNGNYVVTPNGRDRVGGAIDIYLAENGDLARRAWLPQISTPRAVALGEMEDAARLAVVVAPAAGNPG